MKQCELRTPCSTLRTARGTRVTSRLISRRVRMLVRILPVRQFAIRKLPNPGFVQSIIIGQNRRSSAKKPNIASARSAILH